jgi:ribonuclease R
MLIEEFMLMANKAVAESIHHKEKNEDTIPFIYRVHDLPDMDKLAGPGFLCQGTGFSAEIIYTQRSIQIPQCPV